MTLVNKTLATPEFHLKALKLNWKALAYIPNPTQEMCLAAYEQDIRALGYIWPDFSPVRNHQNEVINDYLNELTVFSTQRDLEWKMYQESLQNQNISSTGVSSRMRRDVF